MKHRPNRTDIIDLLKLNSTQRITIDTLLSIRESDYQELKVIYEELLHLCKSALDCAQQEIDSGNKKWVTMRNHFQKAIEKAEGK